MIFSFPIYKCYDSGIFGTLSVSDLNNNCVVDEPILINILNIPNNGDNDMSISISDLEAADYVYVIEDSFGCQVSSCFTISNDFLNPDPNVFFGFEDATCFNASGGIVA